MNVSYASAVYFARLGQNTILLAPDSENVPTVVSEGPPFLRCEYILEEAAAELALDQASRRLSEYPSALLMMLPSPDGPPLRDAIIFARAQTVKVSWRDGSCIGHGLTADLYLASTAKNNHAWGNDQRLNKPAYFLTGGQGATSLWRILRSDLDLFNRYLFNLLPIQLPAGLPTADFSKIEDLGMRTKAQQHWKDLQENLIRNRHYPVITAAKLLAETLSAYYLEKAGCRSVRDLKPMLDKISESAKAKDNLTPFTDLDCHLMNKIRILHARTHPTNPTSRARRMRPEFASSVAEDIAEVISSIGLVVKN